MLTVGGRGYVIQELPYGYNALGGSSLPKCQVFHHSNSASFACLLAN